MVWLRFTRVTWNEKVDLVEARLKDFGDRYISLLGKVTVINRFVFPLLWYPGTVLAAPEGVLVRLERAVFRFPWKAKTDLVRRKVVYQVPRQGGLSLVHFPSKLRFLLTKCVCSAVDRQMPFAYFVRYRGGLSFRWFFPTLFSNSVPHSVLSDEGNNTYYVNCRGRFAVQCGGPVPGHF
ncbi:hypothetical protein HOLleu_01051 [Holothuria leucospilota]|uniref:Uncharacterized protein n=1 Tax=Holothuria leucospilota TaxID=206669 RepID=A0A9Q1CNI9_HOLLE|nr:hypothetical protein HOLleu_01051 [Holothuria leucospilota]